MKLPLLCVFALGLGGCLPIPHTTTKFRGCDGRVVDARTHRPVSGVKVAVNEHPATSTLTDARGAFHLEPRRNYHVIAMIGACGGDWPSGDYWSPILEVSHQDYQSARVDGWNRLKKSGNDGPVQFGDVALKPR